MRSKKTLWLYIAILTVALTTSVASAGFSVWAGLEAPCQPKTCNTK